MESERKLSSFILPKKPHPIPRVVFLCDDSEIATKYALSAQRMTAELSSLELGLPITSMVLGKRESDEDYSNCLDQIAQDGIEGAVLIYDRADKESYFRIPFWHNLFVKYCPFGNIAILRIDSSKSSRQVFESDLVELNKAHGSRYMNFQVKSPEDRNITCAAYKAGFDACYTGMEKVGGVRFPRS